MELRIGRDTGILGSCSGINSWENRFWDWDLHAGSLAGSGLRINTCEVYGKQREKVGCNEDATKASIYPMGNSELTKLGWGLSFYISASGHDMWVALGRSMMLTKVAHSHQEYPRLALPSAGGCMPQPYSRDPRSAPRHPLQQPTLLLYGVRTGEKTDGKSPSRLCSSEAQRLRAWASKQVRLILFKS